MDDIIVTDQLTPGSGQARMPRVGRRQAWLDLRAVPAELLTPLVEAAAHHRIDAVVVDDREVLAMLPPTLLRVYAGSVDDEADLAPNVDLLIGDVPAGAEAAKIERALHVVVRDAPTLMEACDAVRRSGWTVLTFTDPTKIPLEIVIAAGEHADGRTITVVDDVEDAEIVAGVLEHGSDGLLLAPQGIDDVARLAEVCTQRSLGLELCELVVESIEHIGMGDRACIDTCSLLGTDEGMLLGSFSSAMVLSCSETHPLPYMPTRPFRINAGAVHTYTLGPDDRTRYLSELTAGMPVLAVRVDGSTRPVHVGRVKIERRPLLSIDMRTPDGARCNLIVQDDWHVRLLGPGGSVNNVTELRAGDVLLGHVPELARHVGLPVTEFCDER